MIWKTTEPSWQEEFIIPCPIGKSCCGVVIVANGSMIQFFAPIDSPNNLELHIYDKDPLLSDYLGSVTFDIAVLELNETKEVTYVRGGKPMTRVGFGWRDQLMACLHAGCLSRTWARPRSRCRSSLDASTLTSRA